MGSDTPRLTPDRSDPRSAALARYLRETASSFSFSADVGDADSTARAGMALLDAALIAEALPANDPGLKTLSEAGLFESMPQEKAVFVEAPEIRAAVHRPLVSDPEDGRAVIATLVATAAALVEPNPGESGSAGEHKAEARAMAPLNSFTEAVRAARSAVQRGRQQPGTADLDRARLDLVLVLEQYVSALQERRLPVPHQLHTELRLHKGLLRRWP